MEGQPTGNNNRNRMRGRQTEAILDEGKVLASKHFKTAVATMIIWSKIP